MVPTSAPTPPQGFQRARSQEQRAQRRRLILETAAAMLTEMPVAEVSLNELSRRVGLAKSNVLRYFESREAVLLELLHTASQEWLEHLDPALGRTVNPDAELVGRSRAVAATAATTLAARPVLCDLLSAQAAVLERNVSAQVAAEYKRAAISDVEALADMIGGRLPELGAANAPRFAAAAIMTTGALWAHAHPSAAMLAAYEAHPELAAMRLDFTESLRQFLEVLLAGLLAGWE
ncbi:TetR/AcrR family transcriptional regulator [Streptomyces sp. AK02-01A]|uniref:TetR/AcrR family transcriptional regulator n=1 Tax=Streptomyces sp. AK02-01A TaxID=3028648 RepID=UPI0029BD44A4|nr:TetR/AcrR family transcriptional regulator [Streptomyces sp. AK02-01A]MDX3853915.1 TetR/AcrR family transcriptional regulator [Streptomyces sp. AK02-01A]